MLTVRDLTVGEGARCALKPLATAVAVGELLAVVGPADAGKTVLLKAIAGLLPEARGQVCLGTMSQRLAEPKALAAWQRRIGMAFQNDALFDDMSVFDNLAFPLRRRGFSEAEVTVRVQELLAKVGLTECGPLSPQALSGGMRKRVGIARAVGVQPELALFDEPLAGLDPLSAQRIVSLIVELTHTLGVPALLVSNDLPVVLPVATRVLLLRAGRVLYDGVPGGLASAPSAYVRAFVTGSEPPEEDDIVEGASANRH